LQLVNVSSTSLIARRSCQHEDVTVTLFFVVCCNHHVIRATAAQLAAAGYTHGCQKTSSRLTNWAVDARRYVPPGSSPIVSLAVCILVV